MEDEAFSLIPQHLLDANAPATTVHVQDPEAATMVSTLTEIHPTDHEYPMATAILAEDVHVIEEEEDDDDQEEDLHFVKNTQQVIIT